MAKSIKLRQGTETEHEAFTGQMAEVTFDTTNNRIVLHDGITPGGIPMAKLSDVPVDLTDLTDVDENLPLPAGSFSGTTYVVTVASGTNTYGTGNKYYITDQTGASPTVTLTEGETYRFDQSDSTNTGHPLKFSTTANGTHDSGSEYTTGVTYNGVPGQAAAYTEITVEVGAPTLYYYCQNHSDMGSVDEGSPGGEGSSDGASPMWSLSGDSATFAAATTAKLDTNATNYVALNHPTGWGNSWGLEDGSYAMHNNSNILNDPTNRSVHIWSTDDLSEGMTYQYYVKFDFVQPTAWENMTVISAGSSADYSYTQWMAANNGPNQLAWGSNGAYGYYTHSADGSGSADSIRLDNQGWLHFAIELQSNGRLVHYVNGVVVVNVDASDVSSLTNKANVFFGSVHSWMTDMEVYTGGGIHNPDLLETPPGFTPPARKLAPLDVESVFSTDLYTGNGSTRTINNGIDLDGEGGLVWIKARTQAYSSVLFDTNRGFGNYLLSDQTLQQNFAGDLGWTPGTFNTNGFTLPNDTNGSINGSHDYVSWTFRNAPKFFDSLTYNSSSGNVTNFGSAGATVDHSLGSVPGLIIVKCTDTASTSWKVYHSGLNGGTNPEEYEIYLNSNSAEAQSSNTWYDTAPTSTQFTLGYANDINGDVNTVSSSYTAYLFASLDGISKVGSYTGNGTNQTIDCGFTAGARFILVKRTDSTGDWYVWDTERGIVSLNDPQLSFSSAAAEVTSYDSIDPDSSGFIVNQISPSNINVSSAKYIFYAIG